MVIAIILKIVISLFQAIDKAARKSNVCFANITAASANIHFSNHFREYILSNRLL